MANLFDGFVSLWLLFPNPIREIINLLWNPVIFVGIPQPAIEVLQFTLVIHFLVYDTFTQSVKLS